MIRVTISFKVSVSMLLLQVPSDVARYACYYKIIINFIINIVAILCHRIALLINNWC